MKKFVIVLLLFAVTFSSGTIFADQTFTQPKMIESKVVALTLADCYHLALKQSEAVAIKQELIKEEEGRFLLAFSSMMPKASYVWTDTREQGSFGVDITEGKFVFKQPIFTGFKEFAAISGSKAEGRQREQEKIRAQQLLFTDVADAFYLYLSYQENVDALMATRQALSDRMKELQRREEVGRSRASEIASAVAKLSRVEADLEGTVSQKEISRQLLEFLTGVTIDQIKDESVPKEDLISMDAMAAKVDRRPDVIAVKEAWNVAKNLVTASKSKFLPAVTLEGDYQTKKIDSTGDKDWDVTLKVDAPVFQGGEYVGNYKIARSQARQAQLKYEEKRRQAILEVRNAYTLFEANERRNLALEKAFEAAQKNYDLQMEDYRLNLVSNLDVLQALEDLQSARREWITVKSETKRSFWQLKLTAGEIPHDPR